MTTFDRNKKSNWDTSYWHAGHPMFEWYRSRGVKIPMRISEAEYQTIKARVIDEWPRRQEVAKRIGRTVGDLTLKELQDIENTVYFTCVDCGAKHPVVVDKKNPSLTPLPPGLLTIRRFEKWVALCKAHFIPEGLNDDDRIVSSSW